jgi:hypothetical protein
MVLLKILEKLAKEFLKFFVGGKTIHIIGTENCFKGFY